MLIQYPKAISPKLIVIYAVAGLSLCSCYWVDRGFKSANYGDYGLVVKNECEFQHQENTEICQEVFSCVIFWMLDHDTHNNPYENSIDSARRSARH